MFRCRRNAQLSFDKLRVATIIGLHHKIDMLTVRQAEENDLLQMLEIYNDVILNTTAVYEYEPHTLEMRKQWFGTKQQQGFPVFVAEEDTAIVGFSSFGPFRAWAAYKYSVENSVYVKASERGKG